VGDFLRNGFIAKFELEKYLIGSFDVYQDLARELIEKNYGLSVEEADKIMADMPTSYRASIIDKDGNYVGFIGMFDVDGQNQSASIRFEIVDKLAKEDLNSIIGEYKKWMNESLNIQEIEKLIYCSKGQMDIENNTVYSKDEIIIPSKLLVPGIDVETFLKFSEDYNIPRMQMPFTIKSADKVIGIIGLSNLIWSNRRASLSIFLEKELGIDIVTELSGYIIDEYLNYVHACNVHNVSISVDNSNSDLVNIINNTSMNYFGQIPFSSAIGDNIESSLMYQHVPGMKKEKGILIPDGSVRKISDFDTDKDKMSDVIELYDGYRLVTPKFLKDSDIDVSKIIDGHVLAMQERDKFTIPLGEDKYMLQKGNDRYGISKAVNNYNYILIDEKDNYAGYVNILRTNASGKNAEIEIGIDPMAQKRGLGTLVLNSFYDELFSVGFASVTSSVFEFNEPSKRLHQKVAQLNGVRLDSYYINGKLWDMNIYTKVNNIVDDVKEGSRIK